MLHHNIHINDFARALFGSRIYPIVRPDDPTYDQWDLQCECGQRCRDVLLAAFNFYVMCVDADERQAIIRIAHEQCSVICYS